MGGRRNRLGMTILSLISHQRSDRLASCRSDHLPDFWVVARGIVPLLPQGLFSRIGLHILVIYILKYMSTKIWSKPYAILKIRRILELPDHESIQVKSVPVWRNHMTEAEADSFLTYLTTPVHSRGPRRDRARSAQRALRCEQLRSCSNDPRK